MPQPFLKHSELCFVWLTLHFTFWVLKLIGLNRLIQLMDWPGYWVTDGRFLADEQEPGQLNCPNLLIY